TNATKYCSTPDTDLNFDTVDKALGGSAMYGQDNCWDGEGIRNDDALVPVLPGSELETEAELEEDLEFEEELDEAAAEIVNEIGELEGELEGIEGTEAAVDADIDSKIDTELGLGEGGDGGGGETTPLGEIGGDTPPSTLPKCTILDFTLQESTDACPHLDTYTLLPGHDCLDSDNIAFRTLMHECPCDLETEITITTPCSSGSQAQVSFYNPSAPVGSDSGDFGVPAIKECDRRYNLTPLKQLTDQCAQSGPGMNGTGGWTYLSLMNDKLVSSVAQSGLVTVDLALWDSVLKTDFKSFDGTATTVGSSNRWGPVDGKLRVDGGDPGGV
ncbi:hypothetical protein HDU93_005759, partial [Gonapodya sp. JEL0774]